ncbi:MAG: M50 family metallopeptidase [Bacteroidales bacterium]|nr:M50 family metallopeptidase [Bacteroidales bacterium]
MKFLLSILIIPLILSYSIGIYYSFSKFSLLPYGQFYFWTFGILSFVLNFVFRKQTSFWSIFKHELTHNIFAILTFNKPTGFTVKKGEGGLFEYSGRSNFMITLSPYFYPTISSFILLIFLFDLNYKIPFYIILGLASGFDLASSIKDIHPFQSDLTKYGYVFSILFVVFGIILFWGALFSFVMGGWELSIDYLKYGIIKIIETSKVMINNVA